MHWLDWFDSNSGKGFLALWGAGLLTTLIGVVKVWEAWRNRFPIDIGHNFADEAHGNEIQIRNIGNVPLILTYWELLYGAGWGPFRRYTYLVQLDYLESGDLKLDAHSTHTLTFKDDKYFDWGVGALKGRGIYIRLHVAGKRSRTLKVY